MSPPVSSTEAKAEILVAELRAALAREKFWLQRGDLTALLAFRPRKEALLAALHHLQRHSRCPRTLGAIRRHLSSALQLQEENTLLLSSRRASTQRELCQLTEAAAKLTGLPPVVEPSSLPAHWA